MKAASFEYIRASELDDAVSTLSTLGDRATILAGGQSLLAMMNLRIVKPEFLLDIGRIEALRGIAELPDRICIGALARHAEVLASPIVATHLPLLALAMPHVAHAAVRNRGTFGGSIANADPAAEIPACCLALNARIRLASAAGIRDIAAQDFFTGLYDTARRPEELLIGVEMPKQSGARVGFEEFCQRKGDFAIVGVTTNIVESTLRLVVFGCEPVPRLFTVSLEGGPVISRPHVTDVASWLAEAVERLEPMECLRGSAEQKRAWASVLMRRATEGILK
jgi:aerobic carbon-monoxide dehydrogenase medium subunit